MRALCMNEIKLVEKRYAVEWDGDYLMLNGGWGDLIDAYFYYSHKAAAEEICEKEEKIVEVEITYRISDAML